MVEITSKVPTTANQPQPSNELDSGIVRIVTFKDVVEDLNNIKDAVDTVETAVQTLEANTINLLEGGLTYTAADSGSVIYLTAGGTVNLSNALENGVHFKIVVIADNSCYIYTGDTLKGGVTIVSDNGTSAGFAPSGSNDSIEMNGSTKGGLAGSYVELVYDATNTQWIVTGTLIGSGTLQTPFTTD